MNPSFLPVLSRQILVFYALKAANSAILMHTCGLGCSSHVIFAPPSRCRSSSNGGNLVLPRCTCLNCIDFNQFGPEFKSSFTKFFLNQRRHALIYCTAVLQNITSKPAGKPAVKPSSASHPAFQSSNLRNRNNKHILQDSSNRT